MSGGKSSAAKIKLALRRAQALSLRLQGGSYRDLAATMRQIAGVSPAYDARAAQRDVRHELDRLNAQNLELVEQVKRLELSRLDEMLAGIYDKATNGDTFAIDRVLRIMERRAAYEGLDAPRKIAPTNPAGDKAYSAEDLSDADLARIILDGNKPVCRGSGDGAPPDGAE